MARADLMSVRWSSLKIQKKSLENAHWSRAFMSPDCSHCLRRYSYPLSAAAPAVKCAMNFYQVLEVIVVMCQLTPPRCPVAYWPTILKKCGVCLIEHVHRSLDLEKDFSYSKNFKGRFLLFDKTLSSPWALRDIWTRVDRKWLLRKEWYPFLNQLWLFHCGKVC